METLVGVNAGLNIIKERKICRPCRISNYNSSGFQPETEKACHLNYELMLVANQEKKILGKMKWWQVLGMTCMISNNTEITDSNTAYKS
jgi:hypothetical protein